MRLPRRRMIVRSSEHTRDSYTGLDYADQRYFASTYGRFNTPDPYKASATGANNPNDPGTWNRYAYVAGDPINGVDPTGRLFELTRGGEDGDSSDCFDAGGGWDYGCGDDPGGNPGPGPAPAPDPAPAPTPAPPCGSVTTQLPTSGPGFYAYGNRANQYGQLAVVDDIEDIAAAWNVDNPNFDIGVGEISKSGGGPSGHQSHRTGDDVDIRPLTTTGAHVHTNSNSPNYSATMTAELVSFIDNFVSPIPGISVKLVFFNGKPQIPGMTPYPGHNDHPHIRFSVSCTQ
jgi:RHS repeat-associated protein